MRHSRNSLSGFVFKLGPNSSESKLRAFQTFFEFCFKLLGIPLLFVLIAQIWGTIGIRWEYQYFNSGDEKIITSAVYATPYGMRSALFTDEYSFIQILPLEDDEKPLALARKWLKEKL